MKMWLSNDSNYHVWGEKLEGWEHTRDELLAVVEAYDRQCREDEWPSVNLWSEVIDYSWNMWEAWIREEQIV